MNNIIDQCFSELSPEQGDRAFWIDQHDQLTNYAQLVSKVLKTQAWFKQLGITQDQRICMVVNDDLQHIILLFAAWRAGICVAILDPKSSEREFFIAIEEIKPTCVFTDRKEDAILNCKINGLIVQQVQVKKNKGVLSNLLGRSNSNANDELYPGVLSSITTETPSAEYDLNDDALILFSSGSTGQPKGMVLSYASIYNNVTAIIQRLGYQGQGVAKGQETRLHNALPFHHVDGLLHGPVLVLLCGATLVRSAAFSMTTIEQFVGTMYRHKITHLMSVPTILAMLLRHKEQFDGLFQWPEFKGVASSAGVLDATMWGNFETVFKTRITNIYGLSEVTNAATAAGPDDLSHRIGSVGTSLQGAKIRIVDQSGSVASDGQTGEVQIAGNLLFSRYLNKPEETAATLCDGWVKTGDVGVIDADGVLTIVGRIKNIIIKGGENINSEELQFCMQEMDDVIHAEVIGIPDDNWGEKIIACVVRKSEQLGNAELFAHCAARLSEKKLPDEFMYFQELPFGPSGKVQRQKLKQIVLDRLAHDVSDNTAVSSIESNVLAIAAKVFKCNVDGLSVSSTPNDVIGWDSLAHLNLLTSVEEKFALTFSAKQMLTFVSLSDIIAAVGRGDT